VYISYKARSDMKKKTMKMIVKIEESEMVLVKEGSG
jgi:uncharacterized beta-barrel protein YwiB (DUF1934 family)